MIKNKNLKQLAERVEVLQDLTDFFVVNFALLSKWND